MVKEKKWFIKILFIIIGIVILVPCTILLKNAIMDSGKANVAFYYRIANGTMKPIEKKMEIAAPEVMALAVLEELKTGGKTEGIIPAVPQELIFRSVAVQEQNAVIDVSSRYYAMGATEEAICRSSMVWTLTSLDEIDSVTITVEGAPLLTKEGEPYGAMNRQNVLIDTEVSATTTKYTILKLYFANADGSDLVVEERMVEVNANQPRERTILEQLIIGPKEKNKFGTIPAETKIRDVTTTNDGVCYVNLSQDFVSKHNGGSTGELLTIYSIVNSLCEMETVEKVQFLIEGEKLESFKGHVDFSTPFVAVNSLNTVGKTE